MIVKLPLQSAHGDNLPKILFFCHFYFFMVLILCLRFSQVFFLLAWFLTLETPLTHKILCAYLCKERISRKPCQLGMTALITDEPCFLSFLKIFTNLGNLSVDLSLGSDL